MLSIFRTQQEKLKKKSFWSLQSQGSLLISIFQFSIKPDLRGLGFSLGDPMQFFIKYRQFVIKSVHFTGCFFFTVPP